MIEQYVKIVFAMSGKAIGYSPTLSNEIVKTMMLKID
jgi:hypothetical protein